MNKTQYLVNKGRIPDPANGNMWIVKSTRAGVSMYELPIWDISDSSFVRQSFDPIKGKATEPKVIHQKTYVLKESPYDVAIEEGKTHGEQHGYGTGCGDLWSWSYFGSLDKAVAQEIYEKETHRVQMTYMLNL